ncbi:hypothetical protein NST33_17770 [Paenibacillus sp. FSL L8-0435]|uniref:hypothetical protein n=1 Tax=Paenibacillus sp. FSL L8-0435 TaxID=2954618 RepID=UPI0030D6D0A7
MSKFAVGEKFKLKATGQRFKISKVITMYQLSPIGAPSLTTESLTEQEVLEEFVNYDK